jgi:hypothetical protein
MKPDRSISPIAITIATMGLLGSWSASAGQAHSVLETYLASGAGGNELQVGNNLVGTVNVTCPKRAATCTLALNAMDELCNTGGGAQIIVTVDGTVANNGQAGFNGIGSGCGGTTWQGSFTVEAGKHEVDLITDSNIAQLQGPWSVSYTVMKP